jgi:hypothetical protein
MAWVWAVTAARCSPRQLCLSPLLASTVQVQGAGAAVRPAILYTRSGPMRDEHGRLAIRAVIQSALPNHPTKPQITKAAETSKLAGRYFQRKFNTYTRARWVAGSARR